MRLRIVSRAVRSPARVVQGGARLVATRGVARPVVRLRRLWLTWRLHFGAWLVRSTVDVDISPRARIGKGIELEFANKAHTSISIGPATKIGDGVRFRLYGGSISLGEEVDVRAGAVLTVAMGGRLVLDGPNNLSYGVTVHCSESIHLAKFAHVAEYSTIVDNSHYYTDPDGWSYHNTKTAPIELEQDVWVCPKATITSGVTIGHHSIVASNTVVVKDMPSGVLISGVPGKIVRELDLPWQ